MPRRKTSRTRRRSLEKRLEMRVTSPRIVCFGVLRSLKRTMWLVFLVALLGGALWGARVGLRHIFIDNEEFRLQAVQLETNGMLTELHLVELTGLDLSASIFAIDLDRIREDLESRPGIEEVEVQRRLPGTLRVKVTERIPVAWLECRPLGISGKDPRSGRVLDESGVCFLCQPWWEERARALPVVMISHAQEGDIALEKPLRHREAQRGLKLLTLSDRTLREAGWGLPVVAVKNDFSLLAATSDGTFVTFGMHEHERQLADLLTVREHVARKGRRLASVNLIPSRNTPVRYLSENPEDPDFMPIPENRLERDIRALLNRG